MFPFGGHRPTPKELAPLSTCSRRRRARQRLRLGESVLLGHLPSAEGPCQTTLQATRDFPTRCLRAVYASWTDQNLGPNWRRPTHASLRHLTSSMSPAVHVNKVARRLSASRLEIGSFGVGDRTEGNLLNRVEWYAKYLRYVRLSPKMDCRPARSEPTIARCQHKTPSCLDHGTPLQ